MAEQVSHPFGERSGAYEGNFAAAEDQENYERSRQIEELSESSRERRSESSRERRRDRDRERDADRDRDRSDRRRSGDR